MTNWISVKDRLPDENEIILLCDGKEVTVGFRWNGFITGEIRWNCQDDWFETVTHWMPLPELPKETKLAEDPLESRTYATFLNYGQPDLPKE